MGLKIFGAGGIDQKSNDLLRLDEDLRDSQNVMNNVFNEYVKRPGTDDDVNFGAEDFNDVIFIKSMDEYFFWNGTNYISYKEAIKKLIYSYYIGTDSVSPGDISLAEYLNTAIFTHQDGPLSTMKYDGNSIYKAGLPTPEISGTTGGSFYILYFYQFIDGKGNTIFGPATILKNVAATGTFTTTTLMDSGFYAGYIKLPLTIGSFVPLTEGARTITYDSISPDVIVGYKAVFKSSPNSAIVAPDGNGAGGDYHVILEVESINVGLKTITFTAASFKGNEILFGGATGNVNVLGNLSIRYYFSQTSETTGFYGLTFDAAYSLIDSNSATNTITYDLAQDRDVLLSNVYDITTSKLRPPKCRYINTYGYQLVCSNILSFWDFNNRETIYTNNDLVMYSDISTGDLGENFSEANRQLIGDTFDGEITGAARVKDSMIIFKNKSPYSLDGILVPGQYTLRKIETNEIGCISDKSILLIDGGLIFQGQDGLYGIDGYTCKKITEKLDSFFKTASTSSTRSVMNNELNQYIFWTPSGIAVFDYDFKRWFLWSGIDASKGITVNNEGSIRFFNSTSGKQFTNLLEDSGVAIDAWIKSSWFTLNEPSLLKKATDIRTFCLNNEGQTIQLTYFFDWSEAKFKGPYPVDLSLPATKSVLRKLDIIQNQSFSFMMRNNVIGENLNISGYEVVTEVIQFKDKNVK